MSNEHQRGDDSTRPADPLDSSNAPHLASTGSTPPLPDQELSKIIASLSADDLAPPSPPASVWSRIVAEINTVVDDVSTASPDTDGKPSGRGGARISPLRRRQVGSRSRTPWFAAAAVLLVAVTGALLWTLRSPTSKVVATARLRHEDGFDEAGSTSSASAELIERDGSYQIALREPTLPTELGEPADLELWLIEQRTDGSLDVQPVGIIDNGDGTFSVPDGLDPATHNIVDISIEPRDGDATHSGRSILRGPLVEA